MNYYISRTLHLSDIEIVPGETQRAHLFKQEFNGLVDLKAATQRFNSDGLVFIEESPTRDEWAASTDNDKLVIKPVVWKNCRYIEGLPPEETRMGIAITLNEEKNSTYLLDLTDPREDFTDKKDFVGKEIGSYVVAFCLAASIVRSAENLFRIAGLSYEMGTSSILYKLQATDEPLPRTSLNFERTEFTLPNLAGRMQCYHKGGILPPYHESFFENPKGFVQYFRRHLNRARA